MVSFDSYGRDFSDYVFYEVIGQHEILKRIAELNEKNSRDKDKKNSKSLDEDLNKVF